MRPPLKRSQYNLEDRTSRSSKQQHKTIRNNWRSQAGTRAQNCSPGSFPSRAQGPAPSLFGGQSTCSQALTGHPKEKPCGPKGLGDQEERGIALFWGTELLLSLIGCKVLEACDERKGWNLWK